MGDWRDVPCKEWTKSRNPNGYGQRVIQQKSHLVHRLAWEEVNGPIPEGLFVLHHCDNPPCYEVSHLFLGTKKDNAEDSVRKGRHWGKSKTHCVNGHEYTPENTKIRRGQRMCVLCEKATWQRSADRKNPDRPRRPTPETIRTIRTLWGQGGKTWREVAMQAGVSPSTVGRIVSGHSYRDIQ